MPLSQITLASGASSDTGTFLTLDGVTGTAGTANTHVQTVQGIASMTPIKASQVDSGGTDMTDTSNHALKVNVVAGSGLNANGQATKANSAPVVPASDWVYNTGKYVAVAASQTDAVIQASTGAAGDYLDHVVVI